jgi:chromosomal replication initiator protein
MNAEQAWQSVLGLLQMEMPRASFDTWVRNTKPVSYQNRILTIGVHNAYARDWLESRLASTVSRLLVGIMNDSVAVTFIRHRGQNSPPEAHSQCEAAAIRSDNRYVANNPEISSGLFFNCRKFGVCLTRGEIRM